MTARIALVDDDKNIQTSVAMFLENEGYQVDCYGDGLAALAGLAATPAALVVLDIKMPRLDGFETLARLRKTSMVPVIFLTSKADEEDQVQGLKSGADDYVTKPFSQNLLLARIKALLRRHNHEAPIDGAMVAAADDAFMVRGPLRLDLARHMCYWQDKEVDLTVTEFLLVQSLVEKPGFVRTRDQLIAAAYGDNVHIDDRIIDSHIKRLRRKFRDVDDGFDAIETLYGAGYRFR